MSLSLNPPLQYIVFTVINSLILALILLRLYFRFHIRRFWWEDAWAAIAFISGATFVITEYILSVETNDFRAGHSNNHPDRSVEFRMFSCWSTSVFSTIAIYAVRTSVLYSIIRIMSPSCRIRTFARIVVILLFIFCAASVALRLYLCNLVAHDEIVVPHNCVDGGVFSFFQLSTDCVSDAILVILPLKLLWRVKLPRRQRRMILTLFSSSAIVSIFSLVHGVLPEFHLTLNLETMFALIVCNLLVLVTCVYRLFRKLRGESDSTESDDSSEDDDFTTRAPARMTTEVLTTVDLDVDTSYSGAGYSASCSSQNPSNVDHVEKVY